MAVSRLKLARVEKELSQAELAEKAGVTIAGLVRGNTMTIY